MQDEDVVDFIANAIDHVEETSTDETRSQDRKKLAVWLHKKFNISLKGVFVSIEDGKAYMSAEFLDDDKTMKEVKVLVDKWQDRFMEEMKKTGELNV